MRPPRPSFSAAWTSGMVLFALVIFLASWVTGLEPNSLTIVAIAALAVANRVEIMLEGDDQ